MPSQRFNTTVAAGTTVANIMAGSQFEFMGRPARVQVYQVGDPAAAGPYNSEVFFGQELELADGPGPIGVAAIGPTIPDDLVLDDVAAPGDRLIIRLTETGGAANAIVRTLVVITPIAV